VCGTTARGNTRPSAGDALDSTGAVTGEAKAVALMEQMLHGNAALLQRMEHMEAQFAAQFAAINAKFDAGPDLISRHAWSFWR